MKVIFKKKYKNNLNGGFTMLIAIITTSVVLVVSLVIANLALKQLLLLQANKQSQIAFYTAESAVNCAIYWDVANRLNPKKSAFDIATPGTVICGTAVSIMTGTPDLTNVVGNASVSSFRVYFESNNTCADVTVDKSVANQTTIRARGYNSCLGSTLRKFERGIEITY